MQTLYLIRHTLPDIMPELCYGQLNIDVRDSFEDEARIISHWLPELELVITSPLLRTRKLADFVTQAAGCEQRSDARLMEKNFGVWEGLAWEDIPRWQIDEWAADVMTYAPTGGESAQQLMQRVQDFLLDLDTLPQQHIALVSHAGTIRAILSQLADISLEDTLNWQIDYGAVITARRCAALSRSIHAN